MVPISINYHCYKVGAPLPCSQWRHHRLPPVSDNFSSPKKSISVTFLIPLTHFTLSPNERALGLPLPHPALEVTIHKVKKIVEQEFQKRLSINPPTHDLYSFSLRIILLACSFFFSKFLFFKREVHSFHSMLFF